MGIYFTQVVDWSLTGVSKTKAPADYVCSERWSLLLLMPAWAHSSNARAMAMSSVPDIKGSKSYYATAAETRTPDAVVVENRVSDSVKPYGRSLRRNAICWLTESSEYLSGTE
jgi:hypothetical protein